MAGLKRPRPSSEQVAGAKPGLPRGRTSQSSGGNSKSRGVGTDMDIGQDEDEGLEETLRSYEGAEERGAGATAKRHKKAKEAVLTERMPTMRILDVGALSGTAYASYPWLRATSIDINPRGPSVHRFDFFDLPEPTLAYDEACMEELNERRAGKTSGGQQLEADKESMPKGTRAKRKLAKLQREMEARTLWKGPFDVVSLSLVVNFVGDLSDRGRMLHHAHRYLRPRGWLYLVLPLACVENSRYLDSPRLRSILESCGFDVVRQDDSSRLSRWLCRRKEGDEAVWDGTTFRKEQIRTGGQSNNFAIVLNR